MEDKRWTIRLDDLRKIITIKLIHDDDDVKKSEPIKRKVGRPRKVPEVPVKHRGPTKYNLFISAALKKIAEENPDMPSTERMQLAQDLYRKVNT